MKNHILSPASSLSPSSLTNEKNNDEALPLKATSANEKMLMQTLMELQETLVNLNKGFSVLNDSNSPLEPIPFDGSKGESEDHTKTSDEDDLLTALTAQLYEVDEDSDEDENTESLSVRPRSESDSANPYANFGKTSSSRTIKVCVEPISATPEQKEDRLVLSPLWSGVQENVIPSNWEGALWKLKEKFPWMEGLINEMSESLALKSFLGSPFHLQSYLLVGPPGVGKTRLVREFASALSIPFSSYTASGAADNRFLQGTAYGWGTATPAWPTEMMAKNKTSNPWLMIDEIEKVSSDNRNGRIWDSLLQLLEPESSERFMDEFLRVPVDTSGITWWLCANEVGTIPGTLLSRLKQYQVTGPNWKDETHVKAACMVALEDWFTRLRVSDEKINEIFNQERKNMILDILQDQKWKSLRSLQKGTDTVCKISLKEMTKKTLWAPRGQRMN